MLGSQASAALQAKVLVLPLSPSLDHHGTRAGGVGRVKAMQRAQQQRTATHARQKSLFVVATTSRPETTPAQGLRFPAPRPLLLLLPPAAAAAPLSNGARLRDTGALSSADEEWGNVASPDSPLFRVLMAPGVDAPSPAAQRLPSGFDSSDYSFSGGYGPSSGGRLRSSSALRGSPQSSPHLASVVADASAEHSLAFRGTFLLDWRGGRCGRPGPGRCRRAAGLLCGWQRRGQRVERGDDGRARGGGGRGWACRWAASFQASASADDRSGA
jgi:hypothetical protein